MARKMMQYVGVERSRGCDLGSQVNQALGALGCVALGAALMFTLDPDRGRRRRSVFRGKMTRTVHDTQTALRKTAEYTWGRLRGLAAEARGMFREDYVDDQKLSARARSSLGRATSHPRAIEVSASGGTVTLRGHVLADEEDLVLRAVGSVRGVEEIINQLRVHSRRDVPELQGGSRREGMHHSFMQTYWPPTTRLAASTIGASVALYGLSRQDLPGVAMALGGGLLMARGLSNLPTKRIVGIGAGRRAIDVQKIININAPADRVFEFFADYANFPHFMRNIREVRDDGNGRSHWVVAGPAGIGIEWDADVTQFIPQRVIAWKSVEGSTVDSAGIIKFQPNDRGGTRVDIKLSYNPPGGAIGHVIARVFGADPKSEMDEDLLRVKTALETGHAPHDAAQPLRGRSVGSGISSPSAPVGSGG